jgi:hypothetical protein
MALYVRLSVIDTPGGVGSKAARTCMKSLSSSLEGCIPIQCLGWWHSMGAGSASYVAWYEGVLKPQASVKEQLLCAFGEAHERLITTAEAATARGVSYEGDFGPREVLAHIVGWEAEATEWIPLLVGGAPALTYDDHAFNAAVLTVLGDHPFEVVGDMLLRTHQHFAQMLSTLEDTVFVPGNSVYERVKA